MSSVQETAYPRLNADLSEQELKTVFTPSPDESAFVDQAYRQAPKRLVILVQLKVLQRLGTLMALSEIPRPIIEHIAAGLAVRAPSKAECQRYDQSGSRTQHLRMIRTFVGIRAFEVDNHDWLMGVALQAAATKQELADIINVMIEELAHHRFELPSFAFLLRMATLARTTYNNQAYKEIVSQLTPALRERLDRLLDMKAGKSRWDQLKREPKQPSVREVASFLQHIQELVVLEDGLPKIASLSMPKRTQFVTEARALDIADMRSLKADKRYALTVLLVQAQLQKAMDDIAEIFIKSVRNMHHVVEERLKAYQLEHADQTERLIGQFREVLTAYQLDGSEPEKLARIHDLLDGDPEPWIIKCDEHLAYAGNNYFPFMLQPYKVKRSLLFQCLDALALRASSQDDTLLRALEWMRRFRSSHKENLLIAADDLAELSLSWIPDRWTKLIFAPEQPSGVERLVNRKYFELCVFTQVMQDLKSGDLYAEHSDQYDDYRNHLASWEECGREIVHYGELVGLPMDSAKFVNHLENELKMIARQVDDRFPDNEHVDLSDGGLIIRRNERQPPPANLELIDQAVTEQMDAKSILDILTETEQWLDLHAQFGPLSGFEAKIDDPRKRFISTLFCYGCNLGPTQTARSVKGLSRKQVA